MTICKFQDASKLLPLRVHSKAQNELFTRKGETSAHYYISERTQYVSSPEFD